MRYTENVQDLEHRIRAHKLYSRATVESIVGETLDRLDQPPVLLDLGCGSGNYYELFASKSRHYVGLDVNEELLRTFAGRHPNGPILIQSSMDELPRFVPGSLDAIYAMYSIYYTEDPKRLVATLRESLRSGGQLVVLGPGRSAHAPEIAAFSESKGGVAASGPAKKSSRIENFHDVIVPLIVDTFASADVSEVDTSLVFPDAAEWATYVAATPELRERFATEETEALRRDARAWAEANGCMTVTKGMLAVTAVR